jgi:hypothetical protein
MWGKSMNLMINFAKFYRGHIVPSIITLKLKQLSNMTNLNLIIAMHSSSLHA